MMDVARIDLELPDSEAQALAQFVKRVTWNAMRECAVDEGECYEIRAAMNTTPDDPLNNAAAVLDAMAAGTIPDRLQVLAGALALTNLLIRVTPDRELIDAAAGLDALATGRKLDLNKEGRTRAAKLAARVRRELSHPSDEAPRQEWIIQRCINAFRNEYEDWPDYCERLMTREEMMIVLKECEERWPEHEFRGHNVANQQPGNDKPRLVR